MLNANKYLTFGVAISLALILSGCNNVKSSEVISQNVSTYEYSDMTCSQLESEMVFLNNAANSAGNVVDKKNSSAKGKNALRLFYFGQLYF